MGMITGHGAEEFSSVITRSSLYGWTKRTIYVSSLCNKAVTSERSGSDLLRYFYVHHLFISSSRRLNYLLLFHHDLWLLTLVLLNPDMPWLCKQCRSRSVGFWRSQLIWIYTVCHSVYEFVSTILTKQSDLLTLRNGCGVLIDSAWQWFSVWLH